MLQLHIPGSQTADSDKAIATASASGVLNVAEVRRFSVAAARGGLAGVVVTVAAEEVAELELADGLRLGGADIMGEMYQNGELQKMLEGVAQAS